MARIIQRGSVAINLTSVAFGSVQIAPPIADGRVWKVNRALFVLGIDAVGTTTADISAQLSPIQAIAGSSKGGVLTSNRSINAYVFNTDATPAGVPENYKTEIVQGWEVAENQWLPAEFFVNILANQTGAGFSTSVGLNFMLELEDVRVSTTILDEILRSQI